MAGGKKRKGPVLALYQPMLAILDGYCRAGSHFFEILRSERRSEPVTTWEDAAVQSRRGLAIPAGPNV